MAKIIKVNNVIFEVHPITEIMVDTVRWLSPPFLEALLRERERQIKNTATLHISHFLPSTATLNNEINCHLTEELRKNKAYVDLLTFTEVNYRFLDWSHYKNRTTIDLEELQNYIKTEKTTEGQLQLRGELAGDRPPGILLRFLGEGSSEESKKLRKAMEVFSNPHRLFRRGTANDTSCSFGQI